MSHKLKTSRSRIKSKPGFSSSLFLSSRFPVYALIVFNVLLFSNTFRNEFAYDDITFIVNNPQARNPDQILEIFVSPFPVNMKELGLFRPLTCLSYLLDWLRGMKKAHPIDPLYPEHVSVFWFHLTNLLAHIGVVLLVFFLVRRLFQEERLALITALIFSAHPVHVEGVTSIVGRAEILCALFYLASLILFMRERDKKRVFTPLLLTSCLFFLASLLSKESGITLPCAILLTDWFMETRKGKKIRFSFFTHSALRILPYLATLGIYLIWRLRVIGGVGILPSSQYFSDDSAKVRLASMCIGALVYLRLLIFPLTMSMDYNFPVRVFGSFFAEKPQGWGDFWVICGMLFLFFYALWTIYAVKRKRAVSFPLLFLALSFFPFANLIPIGEFIAERFLYLPSIGFCLLSGIGIRALLEKPKTKNLAIFILGLILLSYSIRVITRNRDWESTLNLWRADKISNPKNPNLYYGLGLEYQMKRMYYIGKLAEAVSRRDHRRIDEYRSLALECEALAIQNFEESLRKNPRHYMTCLSYGGLLLSMKNPDIAKTEEILLLGASLMPENIRHLHAFYHYLGSVQLLKTPRDTDRSVYFLRKAHKLRKGNSDILLSLVYANILMGRNEEALAYCLDASRRNPGRKMAVYYLKRLRAVMNRQLPLER